MICEFSLCHKYVRSTPTIHDALRYVVVQIVTLLWTSTLDTSLVKPLNVSHINLVWYHGQLFPHAAYVVSLHTAFVQHGHF